MALVKNCPACHTDFWGGEQRDIPTNTTLTCGVCKQGFQLRGDLGWNRSDGTGPAQVHDPRTDGGKNAARKLRGEE